MVQQNQKWIELVKKRLSETGMLKSQLACSIGVTKSTISELLKYGKGSATLKTKVSHLLGISESWENLTEDATGSDG